MPHDGKTEAEKLQHLSFYRSGHSCGSRAAADRFHDRRTHETVLCHSSSSDLYRHVRHMECFPPQTDHSAPGAAVSYRDFHTDGILAHRPDHQVSVYGRSLDPSPSLVSVLSAYAVHSAAGTAGSPVPGQGGKFPAAEMDGVSLHTVSRPVSAGADQRLPSDGVRLSGGCSSVGK